MDALGHIIFKRRLQPPLCLLTPHKQMSVLAIFNENIFLKKLRALECVR